MIGMSYDQIVEKIRQEKGVSAAEIEAKVKDKLDKLSDLISREGAAHIVANELGVNLYQGLKVARRYKVKDLTPMMRNVEVLGKVIRVYEVRSFVRNDQQRKVASFLIGDETGKVRVTVWDEKIITADIESGNVKDDATVLIENAYVKENNGFREVHLGSGAALKINPKGESVGEVSVGTTKPDAEMKNIVDVKEGEFVTVYGTMVNVFEPRFYNACPECNKKVGDDGKCKEHGEVEAKLVPIVNIFLDDGTDNIRVVFFRDAAASVFGLEAGKMPELQGNAEKFREVKEKVMLSQLEITGRIVKNDMFERLEMMASSVRKADPKEVAKRLEK